MVEEDYCSNNFNSTSKHGLNKLQYVLKKLEHEYLLLILLCCHHVVHLWCYSEYVGLVIIHKSKYYVDGYVSILVLIIKNMIIWSIHF